MEKILQNNPGVAIKPVQSQLDQGFIMHQGLYSPTQIDSPHSDNSHIHMACAAAPWYVVT